MKVIVNGEARDLAPGTTVAGLLSELEIEMHLDPERRGVAVAVDAAVVHRGQWDSQVLCDGIRVEVLIAIQGG
ncbi:MAG: sulfur carrier protein ThiS [Solirubrobacterales bacterium]|nr:sulfur carrier protein ThiS [Solirubrobacterales bacterium]